jgi:hypothetical protein
VGERRRDEAHDRLKTHRLALVRRIQRAFVCRLLVEGAATTDAVRILVRIPPGVDPRVVGAAIRALALDRLIVAVGRRRSARPEAHARWVDLWDIRDVAAAEGWLLNNPDYPSEGNDPPAHTEQGPVNSARLVCQ